MTVRVLGYGGDGSYFLDDHVHELDGIRRGPGRWMLAGDDGRELRAQLLGLLARPLRTGRRAFDVVVAAPKPVSVLLAVEPRSTAASVVALHERAVAAMFDYLGEEGAWTAEGVATPVAAVFTHGVNRLLDPHLHSHVVLGARDANGVPILSGELRSHGTTADAVYLAALRDGLSKATGRRSWINSSGAFCVEGVDLGLVSATSVPRDRRGRVERGATKVHVSASDARRHWDQVVARSLRLEPPDPPSRSGSHIDEHRFAAVLGCGLVGRPDVLCAWATACTFGGQVSRLREAADLLTSGLGRHDRLAATAVLAAGAVRVLGPRPASPEALVAWRSGGQAVAAFLAAGHRLTDLDDRGRCATTLLAVARLEAELRVLGLTPQGRIRLQSIPSRRLSHLVGPR